MNLIDGLLLLVILAALWSGWRRGFVLGAVQLVTLVASVVAAFFAYPYIADWVDGFAPELGVWLAPLSFLAALLLAELVLGVLAGGILRAASSEVHRHAANRLLGLLPGAANGLIHASVLTLLLQSLPLPPSVSTRVQDSEVAQRLSGPVNWLESTLGAMFEPAIRRSMQALTIHPESNASVPLHFRAQDARPRPDLEARMLEMLNSERAKNGLQPLRADPELTEVARKHSRDMLARGYFSHETLGGGSLPDRLHAGNVRYGVAGENLAYAPNLQRAHQGLMNSPGHRANILRPQYTRVGIGVLDAGTHGLMVTEDFRN